MLHMCGLRLWGFLFGEVSCPPHLCVPVETTAPGVDKVDVDAAKVSDAAALCVRLGGFRLPGGLESYHDQLTAYAQWLDDDPCCATVLIASVLSWFFPEIVGFYMPFFYVELSLSVCYQPYVDALYLSMVLGSTWNYLFQCYPLALLLGST